MRAARLLILLAAAGPFTAAPSLADPDEWADPNAVKFDQLEADLHAGLAGQCTGYGFAIYQNNGFIRGGGGGVRRRAAQNRPSLPFTAYTRKGCHSMSKGITAAAMIRALQIRGLSIDSPIYPHLPKRLQNEVVDNDMKTVTFRQILAHTSGVSEGGWRWSDLLQGAGTVNPTIGNFDYANWNFAVCRTLIPFVLNPAQMRFVENFWFVDINAYCAGVYTSFVQSQILVPAGIPNASWRSPNNIDSTNFSYYYNWNDATVEEEMPNRFETIGSGGWAMSPNAYALFMAKLQSGALLPGNVKTGGGGGAQPIINAMRTSQLGMFSTESGRFYSHSGSNTYTNDENKEYGGRSQWVHDTDTNITVCIQVNCSGISIPFYNLITDAIKDAFDSTTTTSAPTPEEEAQLYAVLSAQTIPTPTPVPGHTTLRNPVRLDHHRRHGTFHLRFDTIEGATHIIETYRDGLWAPTTAIQGDGSTHDHAPDPGRGKALFRVHTIPPAVEPATPPM